MRPCSLIQTPVGTFTMLYNLETNMLLVDQHRVSQRADFLCGRNCLFRQIRSGFLIEQWLNPRPGIFGAAGILGHGDDFKILVFQLLINCLPAWQVKAAPSPTGPCNQQDFLSLKIRKPIQLAMQVRQRKIRRLQ